VHHRKKNGSALLNRNVKNHTLLSQVISFYVHRERFCSYNLSAVKTSPSQRKKFCCQRRFQGPINGTKRRVIVSKWYKSEETYRVLVSKEFSRDLETIGVVYLKDFSASAPINQWINWKKNTVVDIVSCHYVYNTSLGQLLKK
jgi:hypothetical protein